MLIADPQLVDPHTYPGRPWPLSTLTILHTDLYLRRSFRQIQKKLRPDSVFFLGDLFDGGREWGTVQTSSPDDRLKKYGNKFWLREYARFSKLFFSQWNIDDSSRPGTGEPRGRKIIASLPGNHDLGFATGIQGAVKDRFDTYFGPLNRVDMVGNHTIIHLDTVSLSAMDQADPLTGSSGSGDGTANNIANRALWKPASDFLSEVRNTKDRHIRAELRSLAGLPEQAYHVNSLSGFAPDVSYLQADSLSLPRRYDVFPHTTGSMFPTILLTHVPLYRPPDTDCGPNREGPRAISVSAGYQYQNVLTPLISKDIISKLGAEEITQIYSGDDHDYCEIDHAEFTGRIKEITVKSMSWAMGVRKPGFLAVSLYNPVDLSLASTAVDGEQTATMTGMNKDTIQNHLCLLPDQLAIFIRYAQVLVFTILVLAIRALMHHFRNSHSNFNPSTTRSSRSKHQHPLLPISVSSEDTSRLKASSSMSISTLTHAPGQTQRLHARSQSPSKSQSRLDLGGYGNLLPSSRSSSPFIPPGLNDDFAPAPYVPVISSEQHQDDSDDWGTLNASTGMKLRPRSRGVMREFAHSVWQVAWPALLFYGWVVWNG